LLRCNYGREGGDFGAENLRGFSDSQNLPSKILNGKEQKIVSIVESGTICVYQKIFSEGAIEFRCQFVVITACQFF